MGKIICLANQKGGVGKTSSVNGLAMSLKHKGFRVLCIDFDPQGNLTFSLNIDADENQATIYDVIKHTVKCRYAVCHSSLGVDVVASSTLLSGVEMEFTGKGREFLLRDCLNPVKNQYDYILIDSPPELGVLTVNAFSAADYVLVPLSPDVYSLQGIAHLYEAIEHIRNTINPQLIIKGMFLVRYNPREELSRTVEETAAMIGESIGVPLLNTKIRTSVTIGKSQALQKDMVRVAPKNPAVVGYLDLADELLERGL